MERMSGNATHNLNVSGIASTNGGTFQSAKIEGVSKIFSDIYCADLVQNGKLSVQGSVKASTVNMNGLVMITGDLQGEKMEVNGKLTVGGKLVGDDVQFNGYISVKGESIAEKLTARGRFKMGKLNAGDIEITISGKSVIAELGGERIRICKQSGIDFATWLKVFLFNIQLSAQSIEGDDVYVEFTKADVVRGKNVSIGPGCEIGLVEYSEKLDQDESSKVSKVDRI